MKLGFLCNISVGKSCWRALKSVAFVTRGLGNDLNNIHLFLTPYFNLSLYLLAKRDGHLLGRSQQQKGKKRKSDGELAKDPKKMKEGLKQNLDKEIAQLSNIVENQENQMDDLTHQLKELGYEELEELNEKFAILCPGPSWDVYMSETEEHVDIISLLKYRSQMLDRRIQLLYEMVFKLL
ncbi:hypothetical protein OIU76_017600 [Salix suchowensis]|nr:hypothetical protein OIU76_017600 [Salix suchowensis]KAJ6307841.1 hypothetical protein OIU76_017600 [Salix suchowensis]